MGQRDLPAGQSGQQCLDSGRTLPGQDAGGPLDAAQRIDDGSHGLWVVRAVDHRHGQIVAKGATGTGSAPVEIAFGSATSTGEVCGNPRARQTDRLPICVDGQAGKHPVVAASGADTTSAHRCVETAVAQVLTGPGRSSLVGHPLAPAAAELPVGNQRAAPFGGAPVGANRHRCHPGSAGRTALLSSTTLAWALLRLRTLCVGGHRPRSR